MYLSQQKKFKTVEESIKLLKSHKNESTKNFISLNK